MKKYMKYRYKNGQVIINYEVKNFLGFKTGRGISETVLSAKRAIIEILKNEGII